MSKTIYSDEHLRLCAILRRQRKAKKLTQQDLAARINRTQPFVAKMESGQVKVDVLEFRQICEALDYTILDVFKELESWKGPARKSRDPETED